MLAATAGGQAVRDIEGRRRMRDLALGDSLATRRHRLADRLVLWRLRWLHARPALSGEAEPRHWGHPRVGAQILAGRIHLGGAVLELGGRSPWDLAPPPGLAAGLHGQGWLDDLAALGTPEAEALGRALVAGWIRRHGRGTGPGWSPALAGRRALRWVTHSGWLLEPARGGASGAGAGGSGPVARTARAVPGVPVAPAMPVVPAMPAAPVGPGASVAPAGEFRAALARHVRFLAARAAAAPHGPPRIEALTGLVAASLALAGEEAPAGPAAQALAAEAGRLIAPDGAIASRNPEELLLIVAHLRLAARALAAAGRIAPPALVAAADRATPVLRMLRHADGGLARFHGGGLGPEGGVEALAAALPRTMGPGAARPQGPGGAAAPIGPGSGAPMGPRALGHDPRREEGGRRPDGAHDPRAAAAPPPRPLRAAMGYARLSAGRTSVIADAGPPPRDSLTAHASTGAFEMTSARRPVIVSCGPGAAFGPDWRRAGRATPSHSALGIEGFSSSRLDGHDRLADIPPLVQADLRETAAAVALSIRHDGYVATHGLSHVRELELSRDGRELRGYDLLSATTEAEIARLARAREENRGRPVAFALHFHLHPEVGLRLDGDAVELALVNGERWLFRHDRAAHLTLEPSVWLDATRLAPRPTRQILLSGLIRGEAAQVGWTLAKAEDSPLAIRDTLPGADEAPD